VAAFALNYLLTTIHYPLSTSAMARSELAHLELLAEVDTLVDRLNGWANGAPSWQPAEKCRALLRRLTDRATALRVRIEAPLVVATLGGTGTGKSALVNALVGTEVVQAGRSRPTTMRPTLVCRPDITPEMLGIDPASVEWIKCDVPALRDLILIDCPDPDTTEADALAASNLARLRAILPKCDVLLVTATQQKYRSARVADELAAAAPGATMVFVQTHADQDDDIREDWRHVLGEGAQSAEIFFVDSLRALADAQNGLQPRGEFAELLDLLTRQMAGAAAHRIRRANFLDLTAETLDACAGRLDEGLPAVREVRAAIEQQRGLLAAEIARRMQSDLLANRRQWENRLLTATAARWGLSPFSLVLRAYQGIGGLATGALLFRARTPAQMALWGALEGTRTWRKRRQKQQAEGGLDRAAAGGFDPAELRKASIIVEGYAVDASLDRRTAQMETVAAEAESAAEGFVARVATELEQLVGRLAQRHTGWFTRWRYELLLLAMLGMLLFRLGKNFFYDSWLAEPPRPMFGLEFYVSAGFWLALWCLVLLWAFCRRLRRGLGGEIERLAVGWQDASAAAGVFAHLEADCRRSEHFRQELEVMRSEVQRLQRHVAGEGVQKAAQPVQP
jgi:hypothetical protein